MPRQLVVYVAFCVIMFQAKTAPNGVNQNVLHQLRIITDTIASWLTPEKLETWLTNLVIAALVLAVTYLVIKILHFLSGRIFKKQNQDMPGQQQTTGPNYLHLAQVLTNTLILYGSYFVAAIIILELFNIKVVSPDDLKSLGVKLLKIIAIIVGAKLIATCGQTAIRQIFRHRDLAVDFWAGKRTQTLEVLLRNTLTYVVFFLAGLMILEVFNVNTTAILASAGIIGLAVGFGAQNLVKDIISGFFILLENQLQVGDYVAIGDMMGTVEEVGLRTCKIKHWTGMLHIIPNGEITQITNYSRGQMMAVVTVSIAYQEDIDQAIKVLQEEAEAALRDLPDILDTPVVQGITSLTEYAVQLRIIAPTKSGTQWPIERELRRRFKYALDRAGIEIPHYKQIFPRTKGDGDGS